MNFQLIGILLGFAITLFLVWVLRAQHNIKKAVIGHIWCTFYTTTGAKYDSLCPTHDNQVDAPQQALDALQAANPKVKLANLKMYFIQEDHTFNAIYPPGKPSWMQTSVSHTTYYEGNPEPIVSRNTEKRIVPIGTPTTLRNIRDEKMTGLMVRAGEEMDKLYQAVRAKLNPKTVYLLLIVAVLISVINLFIMTNMATQISKLARMWGL